MAPEPILGAVWRSKFLHVAGVLYGVILGFVSVKRSFVGVASKVLVFQGGCLYAATPCCSHCKLCWQIVLEPCWKSCQNSVVNFGWEICWEWCFAWKLELCVESFQEFGNSVLGNPVGNPLRNSVVGNPAGNPLVVGNPAGNPVGNLVVNLFMVLLCLGALVWNPVGTLLEHWPLRSLCHTRLSSKNLGIVSGNLLLESLLETLLGTGGILRKGAPSCLKSLLWLKTPSFQLLVNKKHFFVCLITRRLCNLAWKQAVPMRWRRSWF